MNEIVAVLVRWYRADIKATEAEELIIALGGSNLSFEGNAVSFAFAGSTYRIKHKELRS